MSESPSALRAEARALLDGIAFRQGWHRAAAERTAAPEARPATPEETRQAARQAEYRRAEEAAVGAGATVTTELRMHLRHLVDLALIEPRVAVSWMAPGSRARKLTAGRSLTDQATIVTPAVRDLHDGGLDDIATFLHELGHQRDPDLRRRSRCEREIVAWRWALANTLAWDRSTHTAMVRSILTYAETEKQDVLGIQAIEAFVAEPFEPYARTLTRGQIHAFEDAEFVRKHGEQRCQCGRYCATKNALAVSLDAGQPVCRACQKVLETDRRIRWQCEAVARHHTAAASDLDRRIAEQRREFRAIQARQRAPAHPGVIAAATFRDHTTPSQINRQALQLAVAALGEHVRAGTVECAECRTAPARHIRREFGADGPTGDTYRALCAECTARADGASAAFLARMALVAQWRREATTAAKH